jgi:hypothetical protein
MDYRHYGFSDLLQPAIAKFMDTILADIKNPGNIFLWNTMPLATFEC